MALPNELSWTISSVGVLGPSPDEFDSEADWLTYKNGVKAFFNDSTGVKELTAILTTYLQAPSEGNHSWTALLFHPKHWHLLSAPGLISSHELGRLRSRKWAHLMAIPKRLIEFCQYHAYGYYFEPGHQALPLLSILKVAVSLHNRGQLDDSSLAVNILFQADLSKLTAPEINELIGSIQNPSTLPISWAQIIMSVAACTDAIDANLLSRLWSALNREKPIHLIFASPVEEKTSSVVTKLLEIGDDGSVDLAAAISRQLRDLDEKVSQALNRRLADALKSSGGNKLPTTNHVYALIRSRATISEAQLYTDAVWCRAASALGSRISNRMAERIVSMPQALARGDYAALRTSLEKVVETASEYPDVIAVAAINALIQMDVANREPLNESMWQSASVR